MNTPSNAGKELLPCPFCGGLPLVNYERIVCEDCRIGSEPEQPGCSILSLTERWNRRTTPPTQSQEGETPKGEWGIEEFGNKLWVGPMRRDGKLNEVVCIFDLEDLKPEAEIRKRQLANIIVQCVNNAGPQSNAIRDAENHADAAQRENDRLRSEVALIEWQNQEKLTVTWNHLHGAFIVQGVNQVCGNMGRGPTVIEALRAARAATEEGKRG